jgi:hypothetical protein
MKRLRVSLRLTLLLVALFAVFFAWLGARRNLERVELRGVEGRLIIARKYWPTGWTIHSTEAKIVSI